MSTCLLSAPFRLQDAQLTVSKEALEIDLVRYELYKMYLYENFTGSIGEDGLSVLRLLAAGDEQFELKPVSVSDAADTDGRMILDSRLVATVQFQNATYDVALFSQHVEFPGSRYFIAVLGLKNASNRPRLLAETIHREAVSTSSFRNKILLVTSTAREQEPYLGLREAGLEETGLADVFMPDNIRCALARFVDCVRNYSSIGQPLRYLLNGPPGTGKTKIIRAIANEVRGCATFLLGNPTDTRVSTLFELAANFEPAVVCIDDVDLLTGNRENGRQTHALGRFLQYMDGFVESKAFVLATTNDKRLVDLAASRPGRFDMVIDVPPLEPKFFLEFVKAKTKNPAILDAFDPEMLDVLRVRRVTGAFLSNLLKHLEIMSALDGRTFSRTQISELIVELHRGFTSDSTVGIPMGFQG
jgi:cell division protease FtsH